MLAMKLLAMLLCFHHNALYAVYLTRSFFKRVFSEPMTIVLCIYCCFNWLFYKYICNNYAFQQFMHDAKYVFHENQFMESIHPCEWTRNINNMFDIFVINLNLSRF